MANRDLDWEGTETPEPQDRVEEVGYVRDADADDEKFGESDDLDEEEGDMADEGPGGRA